MKKPKPVQSDAELSRTVHEWGIPESEPSTPTAQSQLAHKVLITTTSTADADWATHSSISLEFCDEPPLPPRLLNASIDDAVTQQYNPATAAKALRRTPSFDLDTLDLVGESAAAEGDREFGVITHHRATTPPAPGPADPPQSAQPAAVEQRHEQQPQQHQQLQQPQQHPGMLLVPASAVWTVLTVFSLCALALTGLIVAAVLRGGLFWQH